jgi:hypothetical protein
MMTAKVSDGTQSDRLTLCRLGVALLLARLGDDLDLLALKRTDDLGVGDVGEHTLCVTPAVRACVDLERRLDSDESFEFFALAVVVGDVEILACDVTDERMVVGAERLRVDLFVEVAAVDCRPRDHRVLDRMFTSETDVDPRGLDRRHGAAVGGGRPP